MNASPQWELQKIANDLADLMSALYARWQDEKEFEKLEGYALPIRPLLKQYGATFYSMTRRPFGCIFYYSGGT